jgi:transcriptional regulator with XRE-family HTH domain
VGEATQVTKRAVPNDRLRRAREERNWTQAEVAREIGTSGFTVSRWELGVQVPQPYFREKLCTLFTLSPRELGLIPEAPAGPAPLPASDGAASPAPRAAAPEAPTAADEGEARARRHLLAQVWRYWIGTELEAALGGLPRIELSLTERPSAVDDPLRVLHPVSEPDRPLARGTTIDAAYRWAGEQLLVLGDPGAGKTTLLLDLARGLLQEAAGSSAPVPVVFHLSSWAGERRPLARWLEEELSRRYGVARRLGRAWIAADQVSPLLDGLDEVAEEHRDACVTAINDFQRDHGQLPVVVCCRTAPYQRLPVRLRLRGAVVICPLERAQVERSLAETGDSVAAVRALLRDDQRLWELLTTPLFLSIIVRTYTGEGAARLPVRGTLAERRRQVLADYVERMLARPRAAPRAAAYSPVQTLDWLGSLARAMRERGEGVFYLDWMQPNWLAASAQRRLVRLAPAILMVLVGGLVGVLDMLAASVLLGGHTYFLNLVGVLGAAVHVSLPGQVAGGLLAGAVVGTVAGLLAAAFTYERRIAPTNPVRWSWATFRQHLPSVLAAVVGAMFVSLLVDRLLSGLAIHLIYGLMLVTLFKLVTAGDVLERRLPRRPLPMAAVVAGAALALAAAAAISGAPPATLAYRLGTRLVVGLSLGLMFGPATPLSETLPGPGQGIERSRRNGRIAGLLSGVVAVLVFGAIDGLSVGRAEGAWIGLVTGLVDGLSIGLIVGVGVSLRRGTGAYLRHAVLRRLLVGSGAAPRDHVGFLEHASDLILLRRRGAGYEFVHRLLLDHLANRHA